MKPTVRSIAALAGVSRGTVSRVLNNQPDVSAEVRARVLRIIEETGYRKDTRFQGVEKIHIGVIVAHWQNEYFTIFVSAKNYWRAACAAWCSMRQIIS